MNKLLKKYTIKVKVMRTVIANLETAEAEVSKAKAELAKAEATATAKTAEAGKAEAPAASATASVAVTTDAAKKALETAEQTAAAKLKTAQKVFGAKEAEVTDKEGKKTTEFQVPFFARTLTRMKAYNAVTGLPLTCFEGAKRAVAAVQSVCKTLVNNKFKVLAGVAACAIGVACYKNPKILMNAKEVAQDLFASASKSLSR